MPSYTDGPLCHPERVVHLDIAINAYSASGDAQIRRWPMIASQRVGHSAILMDAHDASADVWIWGWSSLSLKSYEPS
jgi:hypothetical protein